MQENGMKRIEGGVTAPQGFLAAAAAAGIKPGTTRDDVAIIYSRVPAVAAGVFTTNKVQAAPVTVSREHLRDGQVRAVVVNSGNANACTGSDGLETARRTAEAAAKALGIAAEEVIVASTGVIGVPLPVERLLDGVGRATAKLASDGGELAARAIMTTDTRPKEIAVEFPIGGTPVRIGGMAKGSGMVHPNMATMLAFVTTDAAVSHGALDAAWREVVSRTFNMVTVDGDTSTNDMAVVLANGLAGNSPIGPGSEEYRLLVAGLETVATHLAKEIARDGEGATKLVEVTVSGAPSHDAAVQVAKAVAGSNLVKTAIFGADANWGRIICAAGYSGADIDVESIDIYIGGELMAQRGAAHPFDESVLKEILERPEIGIHLVLNQGDAAATVWTCDLTFDYIKINASYRT
jgi:glutamate N-acetyltransferase/amino-acid N-acetyltransferase